MELTTALSAKRYASRAWPATTASTTHPRTSTRPVHVVPTAPKALGRRSSLNVRLGRTITARMLMMCTTVCHAHVSCDESMYIYMYMWTCKFSLKSLKIKYSSAAGKYCAGDGLAEPTGDCAAGWYCARGAFDSRPTFWMNITEEPLCPIYSLNETGGVCWPGESSVFCL